jgi:hypothetical protein
MVLNLVSEERITDQLYVQWGAFFAVAGGLAYGLSPVYRGLTVQFKV